MALWSVAPIVSVDVNGFAGVFAPSLYLVNARVVPTSYILDAWKQSGGHVEVDGVPGEASSAHIAVDDKRFNVVGNWPALGGIGRGCGQIA